MLKQRHKLAAMSIILYGILPGCGAIGESLGQSAGTEGFSSVDADIYSGIKTFRVVNVRDIAAWRTLWSEHKQNRFPTPPLPAVNFSQQIIVGVFLGERSNGCYSVAIQSVRSIDDKKLLVAYRENKPAVGVICTASLTYPSHLVSLSKSNLPLEFLEQ